MTSANTVTITGLNTASDTGTSTADGITKNTKPTFTGTSSGLTSGTAFKLYYTNSSSAAVLVGSGTIGADGTWSITASTALSDTSTNGLGTTYSIYAQATDGTLLSTSPYPVVIDAKVSAPTIKLATDSDSAGTVSFNDVSTTVGSNSDLLTNDTTPTLTGTGEVGATVTIYKVTSTGSTVYATTTVQGDGSWSYTIPVDTPLANGTNTFKALQTDTAGNKSALSTAVSVKVDTVALAPTTLALSQSSNSGVTTDLITKVATPTITGKGEAGAVVEILVGSTVIGTATVSSTGAWSFTATSALEDGNHAITARQTDKAGNISSLSSSLNLVIDTAEAAPDAPTLLTASDSGRYNYDHITNNTKPTFTGSDLSAAGGKVEIYLDTTGDGVPDKSLGTAKVGADGNWNFTPGTALANGNYTVYARVTDLAGNTSNWSDGTTLTINKVTVANLSVVDLITADDSAGPTGTTSDNITSATTPTFAGSGAVANAAIKLFVDANSNGTIDSGETVLGTTIAGADGTWSFTTETELADGSYKISAIQTDVAGNASAKGSTALAVTIDTTITAPTLALATASDSGSSTSDGITKVILPTFSGKGEIGAQVQVYDGDTLLGTTTVGSTGTWSYTVSAALDDGEHAITAIQTDKAGNESDSSSVLTVTIDTSELAPTVQLDTASDTGTNTADSITADTTPTFTGSAATAGDKVELFKDTNNNGVLDSGELLGSATADADGNWSITSSALTAGTYNIKARATDTAGNVSSASEAISVTIKTAKPATLTALDLATTDDTAGTKIGSTTDNYTSKTTVTISGATAEAGNTIKVFDDKDGDGALDDGELLGSVSGVSAGSWSIQLHDLTEGAHSIKAIQMDDFGQTSTASAALSVTVDTTADTAPAAADLATASDSAAGTGTTTDNLTNVTKPTLSGTAMASEQVNIYIDDVLAGQVLASTSGAWTWTATTALTTGEHSVTVTQTDKAGNESDPSSALTITVDTSAPTASAPDLDANSDKGTADNDNITNVAKPTFGGTGEVGAKVVVFRDADGDGVVDTGESLGTTTVGNDGTWTLTATAALTSGSNSIKTIVTDTAGNVSSASSALAVTLDTTVPTISGSPTVNGKTLTFTTSESLDPNHLPSTSAFTVKDGSTTIAVSNVAISGTTVTLTLDSAVAQGDTVTLSYTDPTTSDDSNAVQDTAGNDLATVSNKVVTNATPADSIAPTLQQATIDGNKLTLSYNEALDARHIPSVSYFTVLVNGDQRTVAFAAVNGSDLVLTLAKGVSNADSVTVTYLDPTNSNDTYSVQDSAGNDAAALSGHDVTNSTSVSGADTTAPELVNTSLNTSTNILTLTFNETVSLGDGNPAVTILHADGSSTLASFWSASADGQVVTLELNATLTSTDSVILLVGGNTVKDASGNYVAECSVVVGGDAVNSVDLASYSGMLLYPVVVRTGGGADTIVGSGSEEDSLVGGGGADYLNGSWGSDAIYVGEKIGNRTSDTVSFLVKDSDGSAYTVTDSGDYWVGSTVNDPDVVFGFDVTDASASNNTNDKLAMVSSTIAADKTTTSGTAVGSFAKYSISSGMVTLMSSTGTVITVTPSNYQNAVAFLAGVLKAGDTVGIAVDSGDNPDGLIDSTAIYQHLDPSGGTDGDILTLLKGVTGVTLGTVAGQNVVQIVDDAPPSINGVTLTTTALTFKLNEAVTGTSGFTVLANNAGTSILSSVSGVNSNTLTLNFNKTLAASDWVMVKYDTTNSTVADAAGHKMGTLLTDAGIALGGTGATTIDLSSSTADFALIDIGGGSDILKGGSGNNIIEAGQGADTMTGGSGADSFTFQQGDSTTGTFADKDSSNTVSDLDTYSFSNGVDLITDFKEVGDLLELSSDAAIGFSEYQGNGKTLTDQTYRLVAGNYNTSTKLFTVSSGGTDTLVVYDGDSSTGVSETAVVLKGTAISTLDHSQYSNIITVQAAPSVSSASFSTADGTTTLSIVFSDAIISSTTTTPILAGYNSTTHLWQTLSLTGGGWSSDGTTFSISTSDSFDQSKGLILESYGSVQSTGGSLDLTGSLVIGSGNGDNIDLSSIDSNLDASFLGLRYPVKVLANGGSDTITGTDSADTLVGGGGPDTINGGWGADKIQLREGTAAADTVQLLVADGSAFWSGSSVSQTDTIYNFDVSGTSTNDKLELASTTIASTVTSGNGTDVGAFATHSIASGGVVTLKNSSGTEELVTLANKAAAITYLAGVLSAGDTVLLHYDADADGTADGSLLYQHLDASGGTAGDVAALLNGVTGVTLGTTAGTNVVQITDTWGPDVRDAALTATALTLKMSEKLAATSDISGFSAYLNDTSGTNIISSVSTTDNQLSVNFNTTLNAGDWVMFNYTGTQVADLNSHSWNFSNEGVALAYSGGTTIDLSGSSANYELIDLSSGNGTLIGGSGNNYFEGNVGSDDLSGNAGDDELEGGSGTDTLDGGADNDYLLGGADADHLTGGTGSDTFVFDQGDSTTVVFANGGVSGVLDDGDSFTFSGAADVINDFGDAGDTLQFQTDNSNGMQSQSSFTGTVNDQQYAVVRGDYDENTHVFTVHTSTGVDSLVVYDGSETASVSQTAVVLLGVTSLNDHSYGTLEAVV